jgi:hypothetical protein
MCQSPQGQVMVETFVCGGQMKAGRDSHIEAPPRLFGALLPGSHSWEVFRRVLWQAPVSVLG